MIEDGIYVLEINATDGLSTATQKINIVILDVNEPPSFSSNPGNIQHDESDPDLAISTSTYVDDPKIPHLNILILSIRRFLQITSILPSMPQPE